LPRREKEEGQELNKKDCGIIEDGERRQIRW
jgi:hypothetical protein